MEKEDFLENEIFILRKKLNAINYRIKEREREYEMKYPNSCVIIDFRLFDLYKERKLLENKLSEAEELLGHNHNNLVLVWLKIKKERELKWKNYY